MRSVLRSCGPRVSSAPVPEHRFEFLHLLSRFQRCAELVQKVAFSTFARPRVVVAVEERALFVDQELGPAFACWLDLQGSEGDGDLAVVEGPLVGVDNSLPRNAVMMKR